MIVFFITSVLIPCHTPLTYCATRSIYNIGDRLEQTILSIQSIKRRIPDSIVMVIDGTPIERRDTNKIYFEKLSSASDIIYFPSNVVQKIDSPFKALGELSLLLAGIDYLQEKFLDIYQETEAIVKLSGRYRLNDNFHLSAFSHLPGKNVFRKIENGSEFDEKIPCLYTMLFKIDKHNIEHFKEVLRHGLNHTIQTSIEHYLHNCYHNDPNTVIVHFPIGVEGNISVNGRFVSK